MATVTKQALMRRINRKLSKDQQRLRATSIVEKRNGFGEYVQMQGNIIRQSFDDVREAGRLLGCIASRESIAG